EALPPDLRRSARLLTSSFVISGMWCDAWCVLGQVAKRSLVFAAMFVALVLPGGASPSTPPSPADQAVGYQLDATHDGYMADAGLTAPLTQAWSVTVPGAGPSGVSYSLIADGMVFVSTTNVSSSNTLTALNQATGATIWSHPLVAFGFPLGGLAYDRGRV